ncbi:hypothetical protein BH24ACT3_BH24ACT3_05820 [soil metagenome]
MTPSPSHRPLPPATVPASAYDETYYRTASAGATEWEASAGASPKGMYAGYLARAGLRPGEVLVDLGTGRGELLAVAVELGAAAAFGVEYSLDGSRLAMHTLRTHGAAGPAAVLAADSRAVPLAGQCGDLVTLLDVVEHLSPPELLATMVEAHRLLRPGGRIVVHTMPTRTVYDVTYRLQRLAVPGRRHRWPADPRNELERRMHVNEQTRGRLRRSLRRAGFVEVEVEHGAWVMTDFVPDAAAARLYRKLAAHRVTRRFGVCNLWAVGRRDTTA